jgi:hypothetical protein
MEKETLKFCSEKIFKTGFPLEFQISQILENHGWSLIHNRYYLDEMQDIEREIDIIAYKSAKVIDFKLVTSLIISSKKSESDFWCFLTKKYRKKDPNIDPIPIHNSTNNKILNFMFANFDWKKDLQAVITLQSTVKSENFLNRIYDIDRKIFAFQQMCKKNNTPQNDKNIFSSIRSLIRSENFEISNLGNRIKDQHLYNFNLISVADTEFINLHFKTDTPNAHEIDNIKYLNRHITKSKEDFYKVDFVTFRKFENLLTCYDQLHEWNTNYYSELHNKYYSMLTKNCNYWELFEDEFFDKILLYLKLRLNKDKKSFDSELNRDNASLKFNKHEGVLDIEILISDEGIKYLNQNETIKTTVGNVLAQIYKYDGDFRFDSFIPF